MNTQKETKLYIYMRRVLPESKTIFEQLIQPTVWHDIRKLACKQTYSHYSAEKHLHAY